MTLLPTPYTPGTPEWNAALQKLIAQEIGSPRGRYLEDFKQLLDTSPLIYKYFEKFTLDAYNTGREHFGAMFIWSRMRWYTTVEMKQTNFKLNNNYCTFYARFIMLLYPELAGFFETRELAEHDSSTFSGNG